MKKTAITAVAFLGGCAFTDQMYKPPVSLAQNATQIIAQPKDKAFSAATRALVLNGYQITSSDLNAGVISTAPRDLRVTPEQADCGTLIGQDYLKDNRTSSTVAMGIIVDEQKIQAKANIQSFYRGGQYHNITLTCVSKGALEQEMLHKVMAEML